MEKKTIKIIPIVSVAAVAAIAVLIVLYITGAFNPMSWSLVIDGHEVAKTTIDKKTITNSGLTLIIQNTSETYEITHVPDRTAFNLEKKKNGTWEEAPSLHEGLKDITLPEGTVSPGHSNRYEANWETWYGKPSAGEYRISMYIDIHPLDGAASGAKAQHGQFLFSAEFRIN